MSASDSDGVRLRFGPGRRRLIAYYLLAVGAAVVVFTFAYDYGMRVYEGEQKTLFQSMQVVVESLTTTGYGEDAPWESPEMNLLAVAMQATGVLFLFTALPVIALPLIRDALRTSPPTTTDATDHVVVCAYDDNAEVLIETLTRREVPHVVVEADRETAVDLSQRGEPVVHGDPESTDVLEGANVGAARAVVVESGDEVNPSIILAVRSTAPEVPVVSVAEDRERSTYHRYAGADRVYSPRESVGRRLASKATTTVTSDLDEVVEVGEHVEVAELAVHSGSDLVGRRIEDSRIRERTGANVVGAWVDGEFRTVPELDGPLDDHTVLLVVGEESQVEALNELTLSAARRPGPGSALVAGHGETGETVVETLAADGVDHTVLDVADEPAVDVVGDVTDPETLREAGIEQVDSVILTLDDDTTTIFATLVVRELAPDVEVIARANDRDSVRKIYRAGADYVLSLQRVTGRVIAATVLEEELLAFDTKVKLVRTGAGHLAGETLAGADVRRRTGCTVVAVERDGETTASPGPEFELRDDDRVVVAGSDESIDRFRELQG
jgi:Trk K+ transport system NAD-binding subunit